MSDQPEALRLAEQLKERFGGTVPTSQAAACLRLQHAEIERLYAQRFSAVEDYEKAPDWSLLEATQGALREHMAEIHKLRAECDALRAALKQAVARQGFTNDELISARALIANATGENK